uniref:Uncharacterized protein n=1 Tax=Romanomermis culicivorax TaxID=13658 RepID=A0A915JQL4_ROMCU
MLLWEYQSATASDVFKTAYYLVMYNYTHNTAWQVMYGYSERKRANSNSERKRANSNGDEETEYQKKICKLEEQTDKEEDG